ncbi:MAG: DMT family transporter [Chloroflexi bacterium]|nr:DMT family transporter [Chloroflexota bacterium]
MTTKPHEAVRIESRHLVLIGALAAIGAGMCYGTGQFLARKITGQVEPLVGSGLAMLAGTIILTLTAAWRVRGEGRGPQRAYAFAIFSGLASSTGNMFMYLALSKAPVVQMAPLFALQPLVAIVLGQLFIRRLERLTWRLVLGVVLVIGGVVLVLVTR